MNFLSVDRGSRRAAALLSLALCLIGCQREEISVYRVAKEKEVVEASLPAGWKAMPGDQMRFATFHVTGNGEESADVSVIPLPGQAGTDLGNVNRWRGQLGLGEIDEAELAKMAPQSVEIAGQTGQLYELENGKSRMLAAVIKQDDVSWFFKMTGDDKLVSEQKATFLNYFKTFQLPSANRPPEPAKAGTPNSVSSRPLPPPLPNTGGQEDKGGKPAWSVPKGWKETEAMPPLAAKFLIAGPSGGQATVNIGTAGGGLLLNVNRWRGQLGLGALTEAELNKQMSSLETSSGKATLVDMAGEKGSSPEPTRILAAIVPRGSQTWFYKLMGPASLVEQEKENFLGFVKTVQYPQ